MEQRDPESGPDGGPLSGPDEPGDIQLAAAAAAAEAEHPAGTGGASPYDARSRGPRRWVVVAAVATTAVALATTATALAVRSPSHPVTAGIEQPSGDQSASGLPESDSATTPLQDSSSSTPSPSASTPSKTTSSPRPTPPKKTTSAPAAPVGSDDSDCENTSHETQQDVAMKFSGMTKGAQRAFLDAQTAARAAGVTFTLNSGYRSAAYQQRIFDCWVKQLGSPQAARQYALPASQSAHVAGYAMDIAPQSAAAWLEASAGKYGLCRRYENEPWHFEYQSAYKTKGCPALLPRP